MADHLEQDLVLVLEIIGQNPLRHASLLAYARGRQSFKPILDKNPVGRLDQLDAGISSMRFFCFFGCALMRFQYLKDFLYALTNFYFDKKYC